MKPSRQDPRDALAAEYDYVRILVARDGKLIGASVDVDCCEAFGVRQQFWDVLFDGLFEPLEADSPWDPSWLWVLAPRLYEDVSGDGA